MRGRIRRQLAEADEAARLAARPGPDGAVVCPLCERPIPPAQRDAHHLVPKSHGGVRTVDLHRICHRQVHALFTEADLARRYHDIDALREHPAMARFLAWVRAKPDDFFGRTRKSAELRRR